MKKTIVLFIAMALGGALLAQNLNVQFGNSTKKLKGNLLAGLPTISYIGEKGDLVYLVTSNNLNTKQTLQTYTHDMELKGEQKIDYSLGKSTFCGGYVNGNNVDLLRADNEKDGMHFLHIQYDANTLNKIKEEEILHINQESRREGVAFVMEESQSTEWLGIVYLDNPKNASRLNTVVYGNDMKPLWSMSSAPIDIADIFLSDSAEIVMGSYELPQSPTGMTKVRFVVMDGENEAVYDGQMKSGQMDGFEVVRYQDGKIYCVGALEGEAQNKRNNWRTGFYTFVYNTKTSQVEHYEEYKLTQKDINLIKNDKIDNKDKKLSIESLQWSGSRYDADGVTVLYDRHWDVYVRQSNGFTEYSTTEHTGMMLLRIDNAGHFQKHTAIRHVFALPDLKERVSKPQLLHVGDKDYILTYETEKNLNKKDGSTHSDNVLMRSHFNLYFIGVDANGAISYELAGAPEKGFLMGRPHLRKDGSYMLNVISLKESAMGILRTK